MIYFIICHEGCLIFIILLFISVCYKTNNSQKVIKKKRSDENNPFFQFCVAYFQPELSNFEECSFLDWNQTEELHEHYVDLIITILS